MSFLFKNYSVVKVMYLLIRCCKARLAIPVKQIILIETGVNKQNKHTHTHTPKLV